MNYLDAVFLKKWAIYLVTDQERLALVLAMPAQYKIKEEWVSYTLGEALMGVAAEKH